MNVDVIIVGGGVAGLSAAHYCRLFDLETVLFEKFAPGGRCLEIAHTRYVPGLGETSGGDYASRLEDEAEELGAEIESATVSKVYRDGNRIAVETASTTHHARAVIIASGGRKRLAGIAGERELHGKGVSYCGSCDGPMFRGADVAVIGGGDAAVDESLFLADLCRTVHLFHRDTKLDAMPAPARSLAARENVHRYLGVTVNEIVHSETSGGMPRVSALRYRDRDDNDAELAVSGVFIFVGSDPISGSLVPEAKSTEDGTLIVDRTMETSVPGIFAVGEARDTPFSQFVTAAADGAIAAKAAAESLHAPRVGA